MALPQGCGSLIMQRSGFAFATHLTLAYLNSGDIRRRKVFCRIRLGQRWWGHFWARASVSPTSDKLYAKHR